MPGYFGDEPTCQRCDYPRRLHHLLGVDHDYTEPPNENAPDAGQGIEGNESTNQQAGDSDMHSTDPQSYMVRLIVAGLQQTVAHAQDFPGAIALINADVTRRFGWDAIEYTVTTGDYVRMTTTVGLEVEYRIIRHDELVPENEPSVYDIDDGHIEVLANVDIGDGLTVTFGRYDQAGKRSEYTIEFDRQSGLNAPSMHPDNIGELIDKLSEMHRQWFQLLAETEGEM